MTLRNFQFRNFNIKEYTQSYVIRKNGDGATNYRLQLNYIFNYLYKTIVFIFV